MSRSHDRAGVVAVSRRKQDPLAEVAPGVFMVRKTWGCNVFLIPGPRLCMIDAGFPLDTHALSRLALSIDSSGPGMLVATHCHLDHMGSMARLKRESGASVVAHKDDADTMEGKAPYRKFKLAPLQAVYYKLLGPLYPYEYVEVDRRLEDGDVIDVMGGLEVVHLPGHTEGSIALYQREMGILFTGDTVRNENNVLEGPPPQFTPNLERAYEGIAERLMPLDFSVLLPGHGDPVFKGAHDTVEMLLSGRQKRG